jgi:acyl homoserine lactone synthase
VIELREVKYSQLSQKELDQLFRLRKKTFKERLNWEVPCVGELEKDRYDDIHATYIIGLFRSDIVCGVRLINMNSHNMIRDRVFQSYFDHEISINSNSIEVSRLFIDKEKINSLKISGYPLSSLMFIFMINHARNELAENMCAIVSAPMYTILHKVGWPAKIVQSGMSEKRKVIHYVTLPIDLKSTSRLYRNEIYLIKSSALTNVKKQCLTTNFYSPV